MRTLFSLLFLSLLFTACGDSGAAEMAAKEAAEAAQTKAYEVMMEGHDRAMPMMSKITAAQKSIMAELATEGLSEDRLDILNAANEQLEDANDGMMEWMSNVKPLAELRAEMDNDAIMDYIKEEAAKIAKVETDMTAAIAAGNELVGESHSHGDGHDHDHGDGHNHNH